jgi:hypothetical protein
MRLIFNDADTWSHCVADLVTEAFSRGQPCLGISKKEEL